MPRRHEAAVSAPVRTGLAGLLLAFALAAPAAAQTSTEDLRSAVAACIAAAPAEQAAKSDDEGVAEEPSRPAPLSSAGPACVNALQLYRTHPDYGAAGSPMPESAEVMADVLGWIDDQARSAVAPAQPDAAAVGGILAALREPPKLREELSWWQRLLRWINWLLSSDDDADDGPGWLERLMQGITPGMAQAIWWTLLALLVAALATIVIAELRAAGAFGPRRRRGRQDAIAPAASSAQAPQAATTLSAIAALPLPEQPAALLRWSIAALAQRRLLPRDASMTNGELRSRLRRAAPVEVEVFAALVRAAEAQTYGGRTPTPEHMQALLQSAPTLAATP